MKVKGFLLTEKLEERKKGSEPPAPGLLLCGMWTPLNCRTQSAGISIL